MAGDVWSFMTRRWKTSPREIFLCRVKVVRSPRLLSRADNWSSGSVLPQLRNRGVTLQICQACTACGINCCQTHEVLSLNDANASMVTVNFSLSRKDSLQCSTRFRSCTELNLFEYHGALLSMCDARRNLTGKFTAFRLKVIIKDAE